MSAYPLLDRLKALRPEAQRMAAPACAETGFPRGLSSDIPAGAELLAKRLCAHISTNRFGDHLALRRWFSESVASEPPTRLDRSVVRLMSPGAPEEAEDPRQWLFLDTETTGLAGGTGTYPFLVGIAWWEGGGLEVEQLFMREQSEEHSVLVALAGRMAERSVLVTFNGKSFDWPLLETRYRMARTIRTPAPRAHFDFLHPSRNLWRSQLGSVRLRELERYVLGWNRGPDMISDLIPQIYFDYLRGGSPEPLVPIFYHNQMDLRGLAGLACRVLSIFANPEMHEHDALELFGLSRICERRGETARARKLYEKSIARQLPTEVDRRARRSLARLAKREGDFTVARELWEKMLGTSREGFEAYEQLAIYYEHLAREPHRAAELTRAALAELHATNRLGAIPPAGVRQRRARLERRLARLERKSVGGLLGPR
jgi:uncharacterized protein